MSRDEWTRKLLLRKQAAGEELTEAQLELLKRWAPDAVVPDAVAGRGVPTSNGDVPVVVLGKKRRAEPEARGRGVSKVMRSETASSQPQRRADGGRKVVMSVGGGSSRGNEGRGKGEGARRELTLEERMGMPLSR